MNTLNASAPMNVFNGQQVQPGMVPQPSQWNQITNVREDPCSRQVSETQSQLPNNYVTNNFFRPCQSQQQYAATMSEPFHQSAVYQPDNCHIPIDSQLRYAPLTNQGEIHQLFTRPYTGTPYMGAGTNSNCSRDLESRLIYSDSTQNKDKACNSSSRIFNFSFCAESS